MICPHHRGISYFWTTYSHNKIYFMFQHPEITVLPHLERKKERKVSSGSCKFHKCTNFSNNEVKSEYIKLSTIKIFKHIAILHKRIIMIEIGPF